RDRYRHAIEELSRYSQHDELEVTRRAVFQAKRFRCEARDATSPPRDRQADPGYSLISTGRVAFERELGFRHPLRSWLLRVYVTQAEPRYLATITIVCGFILAMFLRHAGAAAVGTVGLCLLRLPALVPASDLAITLVNRMVMALLRPRALPR